MGARLYIWCHEEPRRNNQLEGKENGEFTFKVGSI